MKKVFLFNLLFFLCRFNLFAQSNLSVASNTAIIEQNSYEYSIGEMCLINTVSMPNLIVTQGFLQPNIEKKLTEISSYDEAPFIKVYPNPTNNQIHISLIRESQLSYQVFDGTGKVIISSAEANEKKFTINMLPCSAGNYFLNICVNATKKYSFKIQKQ